MPNLITQYDNGTFEDILANWDAEFGAASSAQARDATQFFEGAHSVKFTTALLSPAGFFNGTADFMLVRFPGVTGEPYEITIRVKVNNDVPDDAVFFINPFQPDFSQENKGYTVPVRASQAKTGWIELRANYYGTAVAGEIAFYVSVMFNSEEFHAAAEFFPPGYDEYFDLLLGFTTVNNIPAGAFVWMDTLNSDVQAIPAIPDLQFQGRRLYYVRNVFYLQVDGVRTVIDEPIKWDDVSIQIIFDEKTRGYRFEFSDKDILLEFDNAAGLAILKALRKAKGVQAEAQLIFGEFDLVTEVLTIHYTGDLNFEEGELTDRTFKINIERQSLGEKLRTYFDTRVDIFRTHSLGKLERPALTLTELFLHPRLLSYVNESEYNDNIPVAQIFDPQDFSPAIGDDGIVYTVIPPFKNVSNNIEGWSDPVPPDGMVVYAGLTLSPGITKRKFFIEGGQSFKYTKTGSPQQPIAGFGIVKISNISGGGSPDGKFISHLGNSALQVGYAQQQGILAGTYNVVGSFSGTLELGPDEALFIRCTVYNPVEGGPPVVYNAFEFTNPDGFYLRIREQTVFAPSLIRAPRLHEIVNRQLELITDKANILKSNLIGRIDLGYAANGCAADHFGMDGKILRNFTGKTFNLSAKDWYNSLNGLFCTGMSIERDVNDVESVRFEELPYFFRNVLLINLSVISNYKKSPADAYLFNEIGVRFKKYPQDNQQDSIEDFHTAMDYVTPLTKIKNKLSIQIDAIISGYYIEYTRQESFQANPTNAYETDNDLFYISARESEAVYNAQTITFDQPTKTIEILKLLPVVAGDRITIAAGTGGVTNGTYNVVAVEIPFNYDRVILTVLEALATDGAGTGNVTIIDILGDPVTRYEAKRDEDFEVITGVTFEKSVYNLEHHIKRIAIRWSKIFQSGWTWFLPTNGEAMQFTEGANNTEARTRLKAAVACKYGDATRFDRKDSASEFTEGLDAPLFTGDQIEFDAPLTWTTFNYIRYAFEGRNPDGKNYGYAQIKNPDREIERGHPVRMKFKPNEQMVKFTLLEKYNA